MMVALGISALLAPSIALAAPQTFAELVGFFVGYINFIIPVIISAAVVIYMKNTATGIYKLKGGKADPDWQQGMLWGIVIITMMVSLWGILSIIAQTLRF